MDKHQVANALSEIGLLLELVGENPFKVRAYQNAARALETLADDLPKLLQEGKLTDVKGIGKNIAEHIQELVSTGKIQEYAELHKEVPEGVMQMLTIPGLGPKKVRHLWKEMGIKTIGELAFMCERHLLADAPGFGAKTETKILEGIEMIKRFSGKRRLDEALVAAMEVFPQIRSWPEVIRSEVAGSIRRHKEIVKDIDILTSSEKPHAVMERFVSLPQVERVIQHGDKKSEVMLTSGIQCDLRVVTEEQYPFALHYFTGSKEHNVRMRGIAKAKGMKLNEYGLFPSDSQKSLACADEARLFAALGLDYIAPELREDQGEVEAATQHRLPRLVRDEDLVGTVHVHSTYTDGKNTLEEMALAARERGYRYVAICDHSQAVTIAGGMKPQEVKQQHREIDALNKKLRGFRILKGIEVDILADGALDFDEKLLATFDVVIAAIHSRFGMSEQEMTDRIIAGISHPRVNILAHPTGRLLLAREPYAMNLERVIDAAVEQGVALEINAHPQRLDLDWRFCRMAKERGAKFSIGPDAHSVAEIDCNAFGIGIARKGWLEPQDIINCLSAEELVAWCKKK